MVSSVWSWKDDQGKVEEKCDLHADYQVTGSWGWSW